MQGRLDSTAKSDLLRSDLNLAQLLALVGCEVFVSAEAGVRIGILSRRNRKYLILASDTTEQRVSFYLSPMQIQIFSRISLQIIGKLKVKTVPCISFEATSRWPPWDKAI